MRKFDGEERQFYDNLIIEPESESDLSHNIELVNKFLLSIEKRRVVVHEFITYLESKIEKESDKKLKDKFNEFKMLGNQNFNLAQSSMAYLKEYYETLDDEAFEKYEKLFAESKLINEKFRIYAQKFVALLNEKKL